MEYIGIIGILFFILGLVLGSFGNVLIYRIPAGMRIDGRSKCPQCSHVLQPMDLVPILSYMLLRGKCRSCSARISAQYPSIELASGLLFLFAFLHTGEIIIGCILAIALWFLLLITAIDFFTQGIPDILNFPFIGVSVVYGFLLHQLEPLAFAIGTGFFVLQWLVSTGKWVGSGDILLSIGIVALLGKWKLALVMLCIAYISGSLVALYLIAKRKSKTQDRLAFAPFLAFGTVVTLFAGDWILQTLLYI